MNEREIFEAAIDIPDDAQRHAFLDSACGADPALRQRLDELIDSHRAAGSFLVQTLHWESPAVDDRELETVGSMVGPYKLLQLIGEGGMGLVFMAEQTKPLRRRVAIKIIKPGMDTRQVIARFEAERQALAIMDHPNIAKVLDAGTTAAGRPYFVMELVNGIPITQYADQQQLDARQRLELFVPVCEAIQHAHQKGIIHRDLKPSNVLVALYDGRPVPKVIDFGIAKAIDQRLTEQTLFTALGQVVGTLEYMSPEQATRNQLDIDTRSDVYSLGVLLYELLTGETPLDKRRLKSAAWDEILRIIREEEPPSPSAKLSSSERMASIAASRRTEPAKLSALLRGELDWIIHKSLEKDRTRRYESASHFAADVRRYLTGEAILASPPSSIYRLRKFVRRNWRPVTMIGLLVTSLLIGLISTWWQARRAIESEAKVKTSLEAEQKARAKEDQARQQAESSQRSAQLAQRDAERRLSQVYTERGLERVDIAPHTGLPWLVAALATDAQDPDAHRMQSLRLQLLLHDLPHLSGFWPNATKAMLSDNESFLAVVIGRDVVVVDLAAKTVKSLSHLAPVEGITFSRQGDRLATIAGGHGTPPQACIWNPATGEAETTVIDLSENEYHLNRIPTLHFTPDGQRLVAVYAGMTNRWHTKIVTKVFDSHSMQQLGKTFAHHSNLDFPSGYHQLSPDGLRILVPRGVTGDDARVNWDQDNFPPESERVQQYDLLTGQSIHPPLEVKLDFYTNVQYNVDGSLIATADSGLVKLWNAKDGLLAREFTLGSDNKYANLWFHPDGSSLIIIEKMKATWYDIHTGAIKQEWSHQNNFIIDPSGHFVVYLNTNGVHYLSELSNKNSADMQPLPELYQVRFAANGSKFVLEPPRHASSVSSESLPERIYRSSDTSPASPPWRFQGELSASGRYFLCQHAEGVWLWDLDRVQHVAQTHPPERNQPVLDVAVTADRSKLVVMTEDGQVSGYDTQIDRQLFEPFTIPRPNPDDPASRWTKISVDANANLLATKGVVRLPTENNPNREQDVAQVWNLNERTPLSDKLIHVHTEGAYISDARFMNTSPHLLITEVVSSSSFTKNPAKSQMRLEFISLNNSSTSRSLELTDATSVLAITPNERLALLAFQKSDEVPATYAQFSSLESGEPVLRPIAPEGGTINNATLSRDGQRLLIGNGEVWDTHTGQRSIPAQVSHRTVDEFTLDDDNQAFITSSHYEQGYRNFVSELRLCRLEESRLFSSEFNWSAPPIFNQHTGYGPSVLFPKSSLLAIAGRKLRFWDVQSGLPLSGPIDLFPVHPSGRSRTERLAFVTPNGHRLFVQSDHDLFVFDVQKMLESTPGDEIFAAWSRVLTGQRIDEIGGMVPLDNAELQSAWRQLQP